MKMKKVVFEKEGFIEYLKEREVSDSTLRKYLTDVGTFFRYLGDVKEIRITKEILLNYKKWLICKYAVSSANSMIVALNQYLIYIGCAHWKIRRIKEQNRTNQRIDKEMKKEDYTMLVKRAKEEGKEQLALIIDTLAFTGIRISELRYFSVESVRHNMVKIYNKGKYRYVLIPDHLRKKLMCYIIKHRMKGGMIFITKNGGAKDRSNIWRELKQLARRAGVMEEKVFPHNFRHLFARMFYRATKNLVQLADILGHSSIEVTRIYAADGIEEQRKSMEKVVSLIE